MPRPPPHERTGPCLVRRHEIRLAWREWLALMAGRVDESAPRHRLIVFPPSCIAGYAVVGRTRFTSPLDKTNLIAISGNYLFAWALMLSQASNRDARILRPRRSRSHRVVTGQSANVFAFGRRDRAVVIAMALLLATPFVDVL